MDTFILDKSLYLCGKFDVFNFIFVDLFFYEDDYHVKNTDRLYVINKIVEKIDYNFDIKRHDFFSSLSGKEINQSVNIKFVSKIIPFWEITI